MVWIAETAIDTGSHAAPYELRFRFAGSQGMEADLLRIDIEKFFAEMGIAQDQTFYSSGYFDMLNLYLGNGIEVYAVALLITFP